MLPKPEGIERSEPEARFETVFHRSPAAMVITSQADGRMLDVNEAYCRLTGYPREELLGRTTLELGLWAQPEQREHMMALFRRDGRVCGHEIEVRARGGEIRHAEASFEAVHFNGRACFISTAIDITARRQSQIALAESERLFRHVTQMTSDLFFTCMRGDDGLFRVQWAGGNAEHLFGISNEALRAMGCWRSFIVEEDQFLFDRNVTGLAPGEFGHTELRVRHRDGSLRYLRCHAEVASEATGRHRLFGALEDITARVRLEQQLEQQAHTDSLTGLTNRGHFLDLAERELARARRYRFPVALAMLDLDYFKAVNDSHGHEVGDRVLKQFAASCRDSLRDSDLFARIGGEEFVVLFPETTAAEAMEVAERIRTAIAQASVTGNAGQPVGFTTSIGIAEYADADPGIDALLGRADRALYDAKRGGRNRSCVLPAP